MINQSLSRCFVYLLFGLGISQTKCIAPLGVTSDFTAELGNWMVYSFLFENV